MIQNTSIGDQTTPKTVKSVKEIVSEMKKCFDLDRYEEYLSSVDDVLTQVTSDETRASLLWRKVRCLRELHKFEKAEETALQALTVPVRIGSTNHRKITSQLAYLYADWASFHAGNPDEEKKYEDRFLEWVDYCFKNGNERKYFLYNHMGDIMCRRGNYEEALKAYNQAIRIDKKDYWAYRGLANVNFKMQNFGESIKYYDLAIKALEEEYNSKLISDVIQLRFQADIGKMKESRKTALDLLSATNKENQVLLVCIEEVQTTKTAEEEEKVTTSYQKETVHSFFRIF